MKKILFFAASLICGFIFTSCNFKDEVVKPDSGNYSLAKTSSAILGMNEDEAVNELQEVGYSFAGSNDGYEFYTFEEGDEMYVVAYKIENGKVVEAQSILYSDDNENLVSTLRSWNSYCKGKGYDSFGGGISTNDEEGKIYMDGTIAKEMLQSFLDQLEEAYQQGAISEEAYLLYKEQYTNYNNLSDFTSDLINLSNYDEWEMYADFITYHSTERTSGLIHGFEGGFEESSEENYVVFYAYDGPINTDSEDMDDLDAPRKIKSKTIKRVNFDFVRSIK